MLSIADIPILDVWRRLGGPSPKRSGASLRSSAFWRDGDSLSVSLDPDRNVYFDFRDSQGGGNLRLIEIVLNCSRPDALRWLRQEFGLEDRRHNLTGAEREQDRALRREIERDEAASQPPYRKFLRELEARRDQIIRRLRERDDAELEIELEAVYARIDSIREAIDENQFDDDAVQMTIRIVNLLAEDQ
jgi:hypothetical protein